MASTIEPLTEAHVGALDVERFGSVLEPADFERLNQGLVRARSAFAGRRIWNVNSTARGGGVAELLVSLLAYARCAGVDARWLVIPGDEAFFRITKRIHNRLHGFAGDGGPLGEEERSHYESTLAASADALSRLLSPRDAVILHDPQTAGLVPAVSDLGVPVVWRCHVGRDSPNELARTTWDFLRPYVERADVTVFSRVAFAWEGLDPARRAIIPPSIDAFAPKNQTLDPDVVDAILAVSGLREDGGGPARPVFTTMDGEVREVGGRAELLEERPLRAADRYVLQVSRWDALKDPLGVIDGFAEHVAPQGSAHLVYAGPAVEAVADDPEGAGVLAQARERWHALPPSIRERIHLALLPMADLQENAAIVNALQRAASVVLQKSLAEGFGLTVTEAMWKGRAVVASRIGGIQDQIEDGVSGVLLDDPRDLAAYGAAVRALMDDSDRAEAMGAAAQARVREHYLGAHSLLRYLDLLAGLVRG
jgi:trehalose synthase